MKLNLIELSHYNIPHLVEKANQDWISFGDDNLYPNYLLELFLGSAINGALIKSISAMIYGEGLAATNADENEASKESFLKLNGLLNSSPEDVLKDLAMDLKLFGGCYINVIWSRDRKSISKIIHIGAQYIRSGKMVDGEIESYYYSSDWSKFKKAEHKPRAYKVFNTTDRTQASQILMIRDKNPAMFYGFAPDYIASTDYIQLDLEIAQFHLANISNGMFPSMAINFSNGVPSAEERQTIERQIDSKFSGSGNSGRILLTFNDGKDTTPEIVPLDTNNASESYQFLSKEVVNKVLSGHRVTSPLLFGIRTEGGGFGSNADEIRDSYSLFNNTVIIPFQNILLEGLNKIFKVNDIDLDLYFETLKPADFIDLEVTKTQSEEDQEKEGVSSEDVDIDSPIAETEEQTEKIEETEFEPAENEASYNGAQISSAIDIIAKVGEGVLTKEQATVFLIQFLQLSPEVAKGFFNEGTSAVEKLAEKISKKKSKKITEFTEEDLNVVYDDLEGEIIEDDKWEVVEERDQGAKETYENWAKRLIKENKKENFADVIDNTADVFSVLDKSYYRIRFKYIKKSRRRTTPSGEPMSNKSRDFCVNMMNRTSKGVVYRIEDIDKASQVGVNKSFGHKGKKYDLFKYKGGVYCLHAWSEVLYRLKAGSELKDKQGLEDYKKTKSIPKSYNPKPRGSKEAVQAAKKSNNWWKYPGRK